MSIFRHFSLNALHSSGNLTNFITRYFITQRASIPSAENLKNLPFFVIFSKLQTSTERRVNKWIVGVSELFLRSRETKDIC
jgi:hypothetical protein